MSKGLPKIVLLLSFVIFPTGLATSRETTAAGGAAATHATAARAGDEGQTRRRIGNRSNSRRRQVRRAGKRRRPMTQPTQPTQPSQPSQPKDDAQPRDAGQREDGAGRKKVDEIDEAGKKQPPAPRRPPRRYDPVLQPPEKTRVP